MTDEPDPVLPGAPSDGAQPDDRLVQARAHLREVADTISQMTTPEFIQPILQAADGQLVESIHAFWRKFDAGEQFRPTMPNEMQIGYMRGRHAYLYVMFPELLPVSYQLGRISGWITYADIMGDEPADLRSALTELTAMARPHGYGHQSVVEVRRDSYARYRTEECVDCWGLPNLGLKMCQLEGGVTSGALERILGRPTRAVEVLCHASGDPYCEFEVFVED